jgi:hypothetical protein
LGLQAEFVGTGVRASIIRSAEDIVTLAAPRSTPVPEILKKATLPSISALN